MPVRAKRRLRTPRNTGHKVLAAVRPNEGLTVGYRTKLDRLIERMQKSLVYWLRATYRANPPAVAMDASSATEFLAQMGTLGRRWLSRFNQAAQDLGSWFGQSVVDRSDAVLRRILKDAGFTVKFKMTEAARDVMNATVGEQVGLIKSIASEHLYGVQGIVMRSVQQGRDLGTMVQELEDKYQVTRKRASLIARDQNNKATATITRVRHMELGITQAIWVHSHAGKTWRPKHVAFSRGSLPGSMSGPVYDVAVGAPIADAKKGQASGYTWPGVEINCRCTSRPIIPGLAATA